MMQIRTYLLDIFGLPLEWECLSRKNISEKYLSSSELLNRGKETQYNFLKHKMNNKNKINL